MPKEGRREEADKDRSAGRGAKRRRLADDEQGEGVDESAVNGSLVGDMGRSGDTGAAPGGSQGKAAAPTPGAGDASDSDDDAVAPAVAALLADSDAESASSSSSSSSDEEGGEPPKAAAKTGDAERGTPAADRGGSNEQHGAEQQKPDQEPEKQAPAPASPSSESSSSSSSSESESESEAEEAPAAEAEDEGEVEPAEREERVAEINQYDIVKRAILKRDELAKMLSGLPLEAAELAIIRSFVRLAVQAPGSDHENAACVLAEVVGIEPSPPYAVNWSDGKRCTLRLRLRCKRGSSQRLVKISSVSNRDLTETEHEQWKRLTARTGVDAKMHTESMLKKALDITNARNFRFDEPTVAAMLKKKGDLEFDAQKESRMRFLVQCAMSQMDISNIRDNEARELEERYKDSLDQLHSQEAKSTEMQSQWFDKRPNLYSLKMINKKNYERQVRDDRHALDFTLENETAGKEGLNPFQRRACRPLVAWDTALTASADLPSNKPDQSGDGEKAAEAKAAAPAQTNSSSESQNGGLPTNSENRMERIVRAHGGARHILAGLSGFSG